MPVICAIIVLKNKQESALSCLNRLLQQSRKPDSIVFVHPESLELLPDWSGHAPELHLLPVADSLGSIGAGARGMQYAFETLQADAAWILGDDTWPRPSALEHLLKSGTDPQSILLCTLVDPARRDELSRPLSIPGKSPGVWVPVSSKSDLPDGDTIPCRGGSHGALIPRKAWETVGAPSTQLHSKGSDTYSWELQQAGFHFITVKAAEIELPTAPQALIHYRFANRSFFYEPGIPQERQYYKIRNWAWLQRLRAPRQHLKRLLMCGAYILFSLCAMLRCHECGPSRIYNLFRALHNGFYGKLRPF